MLKLLVMLVTFLGVGLALLGLRQHRLELTSESAKTYALIRDRGESILGNQVDIARVTNPWTLAANLKKTGFNTGSALEKRSGNKAQLIPSVEQDLTAPLR